MILNIRPTVHAAAFEQIFSAFRQPILSCPMLAVNNLRPDFPDADSFDAVIFTSQIAVMIFPASTAWRLKTVFAVGEATASAARRQGFEHVICTGQNAADLSAHLETAAFKQALYPSAHDVAADLSVTFPEKVTRIAAYQTVPTPFLRNSLIHRLKAGEAACVPLFSKRTAHAFNTALANADLSADHTNITVIGISNAAIAVDAPRWRHTLIAPEATADSIAATLRRALDAPTAHAA